MQPNFTLKNAHVVDILGNIIGRDQQIMTMEKSCNLVSLLDINDFLDEKVVFFDPFCKAGEILLACAFVSCWNKSKVIGIPIDLSSVKKELYVDSRYFGLSPDERHYRLSLRTFLGNENSHIEKYNKIIRNGNYLSEVDGRLNKQEFIKELHNMLDYISSSSKPKKIIAVGNPPYQENYGGQKTNTGANPIYHFLLEALIDSNRIDQFIMVIPSRWFAGGRGNSLKNFAYKIRKSKKVRQIYDFQDSRSIFPAVDVKGGVCFIHWDANYFGDTLFHSHGQDDAEYIDISSGQIIIRDKLARSIINKVTKKTSIYISDRAWSWNPFNLASNYFEKNANDQEKDAIECFTKRKVIKKINRAKISKNIDKIDSYKVVVPKAVSKGGIPYRPDQIFILGKGQICTETFMVIDSFYSWHDAEELRNYLNSDLVRFLVSVKKITQDITKDTWCLVPDITIVRGLGKEELYNFFHLNEEEVNYIRQKVHLWKR
ncbi:Eco57I restriction-modification methylase [Legionella beliardensis]|uniref:Eco57I restriction-modification methylase n=1 Tax=Legionella beliardensis TaxID=91822 RepID=A0A378I140_9GAMM|nr:Eco57I restriction-modification methylase domain-containing protein [Legionella beliardensis]STX28451.1 Eco57I restriction-modification methylase [Legionella beliardensis]